MTDNELRERWKFSKTVAITIGSVTLSKGDVLALDDFINRQNAEIEQLKRDAKYSEEFKKIVEQYNGGKQ